MSNWNDIAKTSVASQKVYVRGFPASWSASQLAEYFSTHVAPVKAVACHVNVQHNSAPFAFVVCVDEMTARAFVALCVAATPTLAIDGRPLIVNEFRETDRFKVPKAVLVNAEKKKNRAAAAAATDENDAVPFSFAGPITPIGDSAAAHTALDALEREHLLGFDTESRPQFQKGQGANLPAVLQLSTRLGAYVFSLRSLNVAVCRRLTALLGNPLVLKAGVGVEQDIDGLCARFPNLQPAGFVKLENLAVHAGCRERGLVTLAKTLLDLNLDKPVDVRISDWQVWPLSPAQLLYAGTDAWVGCTLAFKLLAMLNLNVAQLLEQNPNNALDLTRKAAPLMAVAEMIVAPPEMDDGAKERLRKKKQRKRQLRRKELLEKWADASEAEIEEAFASFDVSVRKRLHVVHDNNGVVRSALARLIEAQVVTEEDPAIPPPRINVALGPQSKQQSTASSTTSSTTASTSTSAAATTTTTDARPKRQPKSSSSTGAH